MVVNIRLSHPPTLMWSAAPDRSGDAALARLARHPHWFPRVLRSQSGVAARPTRSATALQMAAWPTPVLVLLLTNCQHFPKDLSSRDRPARDGLLAGYSLSRSTPDLNAMQTRSR